MKESGQIKRPERNRKLRLTLARSRRDRWWHKSGNSQLQWLEEGQPLERDAVSFIISKVLLKETSQEDGSHRCTVSHPQLGSPPREPSACKLAPECDEVGEVSSNSCIPPIHAEGQSWLCSWMVITTHTIVCAVCTYTICTLSRKWNRKME